MKKNFSIIVAAALILLSACGGAENKADNADTVVNMDTVQQTPDVNAPTPAEPRSANTGNVNMEKNEILSNIDRHLVTSVSSGNLVVENKLTDVSFQKVLVQVDELKADGSVQATEICTLINLGPGEKKSVKINSVNAAGKLDIKVVKAKSNQLTNGEMILVGARYTPQ